MVFPATQDILEEVGIRALVEILLRVTLVIAGIAQVVIRVIPVGRAIVVFPARGFLVTLDIAEIQQADIPVIQVIQVTPVTQE